MSLGFSDYAAPGSQYSAALKTAHLRYVDMSLWDLVYHATAGCSSKTTTPCVLPPGTEDKLLADVTAHLDRIASDESVVGLYVLDDYPGNISDLLVKVHELVQRANQHSRWAHQTICGFAAQLDYQGRNLAWNRPRGLIHKVLTNYSPDACDVVQIYSYTPRSMSPGASADWSMGALLPDVVSLLEQRGWKPGSPLIGTPMAFTLPAENWQGPDTDQFRTQIEAFCSGGATAIVPFAWDFSHSGPKFELGNDPRLQLGLEEGITACKATWTS